MNEIRFHSTHHRSMKTVIYLIFLLIFSFHNFIEYSNCGLQVFRPQSSFLLCGPYSNRVLIRTTTLTCRNVYKKLNQSLINGNLKYANRFFLTDLRIHSYLNVQKLCSLSQIIPAYGDDIHTDKCKESYFPLSKQTNTKDNFQRLQFLLNSMQNDGIKTDLLTLSSFKNFEIKEEKSSVTDTNSSSLNLASTINDSTIFRAKKCIQEGDIILRIPFTNALSCSRILENNPYLKKCIFNIKEEITIKNGKNESLFEASSFLNNSESDLKSDDEVESKPNRKQSMKEWGDILDNEDNLDIYSTFGSSLDDRISCWDWKVEFALSLAALWTKSKMMDSIFKTENMNDMKKTDTIPDIYTGNNIRKDLNNRLYNTYKIVDINGSYKEYNESNKIIDMYINYLKHIDTSHLPLLWSHNELKMLGKVLEGAVFQRRKILRDVFDVWIKFTEDMRFNNIRGGNIRLSQKNVNHNKTQGNDLNSSDFLEFENFSFGDFLKAHAIICCWALKTEKDEAILCPFFDILLNHTDEPSATLCVENISNINDENSTKDNLGFDVKNNLSTKYEENKGLTESDCSIKNKNIKTFFIKSRRSLKPEEILSISFKFTDPKTQMLNTGTWHSDMKKDTLTVKFTPIRVYRAFGAIENLDLPFVNDFSFLSWGKVRNLEFLGLANPVPFTPPSHRDQSALFSELKIFDKYEKGYIPCQDETRNIISVPINQEVSVGGDAVVDGRLLAAARVLAMDDDGVPIERLASLRNWKTPFHGNSEKKTYEFLLSFLGQCAFEDFPDVDRELNEILRNFNHSECEEKRKHIPQDAYIYENIATFKNNSPAAREVLNNRNIRMAINFRSSRQNIIQNAIDFIQKKIILLQ